MFRESEGGLHLMDSAGRAHVVPLPESVLGLELWDGITVSIFGNNLVALRARQQRRKRSGAAATYPVLCL